MKVMRPTLMTTSIYTLSIRQVSTGPKPRLVVVGSGWGGFRCARDVDKTKYDVTVVSPRNHFLFTPLLPSTTVGTLEFRCVQEPVRTIKDVQYVQASAREIDFSNKEVVCKNLYERGEFKLKYDKLVLAVGTKSNTFGVPGFESTEEDQTGQNQTGTNRHNVFFLKQLQHARSVRNRIIDCFERASSPTVTQAEKRRLLSFIVVGGGPISVEFTSELHQFLETEVCRKYPNLVGEYSITLVESGKHLLGSFDKKVSNYVENLFKKRKITMLTGEGVKEVKKNSLITRSGRELEFGLCVWSTGNTALEFVRNLEIPLSRDGRILVDSKLRVPGVDGVFALGDCAVSQDKPLAMLAQVANQQGKYLGNAFNKDIDKPFSYIFMGSMAQLGTRKAVADLNGPILMGLPAFLAWRSAYWVYQVSITNKLLLAMYWFKADWFGRDISKF